MIAVLQHRIGDLIQDRYEVLSVLGSGAFGTAYGCRDCELDTPVAIKELHVLDDPASGANERATALSQFRHEAIHLSLLHHPHIVSGHYQPHNGTWLVCPTCGYAFRGTKTCPTHNAAPVIIRQRHYLVMEYIDGPNLEAAAQRSGGILDLRPAVRYTIHIAQALQLIHSRGWVHRDVKPDNILLRTAGDDAVLLDFGIATETGAAGDFSTRVQRHTTGGGTLGYAPDSAVERRHPDARSDIHALGMTLYRLLSGRDPLEPGDLVAMRRGRPSDFNKAIPAALDDLILRCVDIDPEKRPPSANDVATQLAASLEPVAKVVPSTTAPEPTVSSVGNAPVIGNALMALNFTFNGGEQATNVTQLVRLMDKYPEEAQEYLFHGDLSTWLTQIGRDDLAARARSIAKEYGHRRPQGVEAFLQATHIVEEPKLQTSTELIDFGTLWIGQTRTVDVQLRNTGRGYLFGFLRSRYPGIKVGSEFEGNCVTVPVTLDTRDLRRGKHDGDLIIDSSAGEILVPFTAMVLRRRSWAPLATVVLWATLGMLAGQVLRSFPLSHQVSPPGWQWLNPNAPLRWYPASPLFGVALWGVLMMLVAGEASRRRSCGFFFLSGSFALFCALLGAAFGNEVLISGDALLRPFMGELVHNWAVGAWMYVGGVCGALYGTVQRWRDVFTTRLFQIVCGWLLAIFIIYMVLATILLAMQPPH